MAGLEYKVFHGVGGVIAEIHSKTQFSVIPIVDDDKEIDFSNTNLRFRIDMTLTPKRAKKNWAAILVDDRGEKHDGGELPPEACAEGFKLGITTIGAGHTDRLARGAFVGAVYLEHGYYQSIVDTKLSGWPANLKDFTLPQLTSIAYSESPANGPRAGRRYHGFQATVTSVVGHMVTVDVMEHATMHPFTFTADDPRCYDPAPPREALGGQASLAADLRVGSSGALFLELRSAIGADLAGVKLPIGEGV